MRRLGFIIMVYCLLGLSFAFAQEKPVELTTVIAKIPTARIIDWEGALPTVNGYDAWQGQALSVGDEVCCPTGAGNYVVIALNRPASNLVRVSAGTCLTINETTGSYVDSVSQEIGEALFDLEFLEQASIFEVETPTATIGVSGTTFYVTVYDNNFDGDYDSQTVARGDFTDLEVLEVNHTLTVTDETLDSGAADLDHGESGEIYELNDTDKAQLTIIEDESNVGPDFLQGNRGLHFGQLKQNMGEIAKKSKGVKKGFIESAGDKAGESEEETGGGEEETSEPEDDTGESAAIDFTTEKKPKIGGCSQY